MDDITLSYTDDYRLRTYTATLKCSVRYSIDREHLATTKVDEEYLICAALIDRIRDKFYNYAALNKMSADLRQLGQFLAPNTPNSDLLGLAIENLESLLSMSSRLTSKQQIHQLLQGRTNGTSANYDQRHRVQTTPDTTTRVYQQAGDTVPEFNAWVPGTSTTRPDDLMDTYRYSQVHF